MTDLQPLITRAEAACAAVEGDYVKDGLLYCAKCDTPKETRLKMGGADQILPCMCQCAVEEYEAEKRREKRRRKTLYIKQLRANGIQDKSLAACTFENANGHNADKLQRAKKYVDKWDEMKRGHIGLLLWGNTGNGKTYTAACVANALIDKGVPVLVTSFPKIINAVTGLFGEEKGEYLRSLNHYDLLVLDDLGAERDSSYGLEIVYNVIDERYKSGKPMIVTTNLTIKEMQEARNMDYQRIYDRVLEMCAPMRFDGESIRKQARKVKMNALRAMFED